MGENEMFEAVLASVQDAHPIWYLVLLMMAGTGLGVSEDALSVWVGGLWGRGENPFPIEYYIVALYAGVVLSDTWTFILGRLAHDAVGERLKKKIFSDPRKADRAMAKIQKYGDNIGFVQRFSVGARLGIAFLSGFSGISLTKFVAGTALGALITLPAQLYVGYLMREQIGKAIELISHYGWVVAVLVLVIFAVLIKRRLRRDTTAFEEP